MEPQLNLARDSSGQYAQRHSKEDNNVKQMPLVVDGSKGSLIYISQMSVCVGQQSLQREVVAYPLISATGIARCQCPTSGPQSGISESCASCGFVENSYLRMRHALSMSESFYESSSFPVFPPHSPIIFLSICTVSCEMPSKFTISIAASQVTLSQHTLLMKCMNWASGLSLFAETTLSVKAQLEANGTWNY